MKSEVLKMDGKSTGLNRHIVWLVPGFASDESDDRCTPYLTELMHYIQQHTTLRLTVVSIHYPFTRKPYQLGTTKVYPLNGRNKWYLKPLLWQRCLQTLEKIHLQQPIHCLHSFWFGDTTLMAEAFARKHHVYHISNLMGQDALPSNRHLANQRLARVPVIAISHSHAIQFKASAHRDVAAIIPLGIDHMPRRKFPAEIDIIGVGSLVPVKNYELWIEVIRYLQKRIPDIKARIIGDGPEMDKLKDSIRRYNLDQNIHLMGGQSRSFTLESISKSKVFLHTSRYEGQGYVFMEAMKAGLPIVTTPVGYGADDASIWKGTDPLEMANKIYDILSKDQTIVQYNTPSIKDTINGLMNYYNSEN